MDIPEIVPGPKGAIELDWETKKYVLLIDIPENPSTPIIYFGHDYCSFKTKGTFQRSDLQRGF